MKKPVGIFSRSDESDYSWLKTLLESQDFSVRSCVISNTDSQFYKGLSQCKVGILYHTKNRGRINVTDVMDSLYDEELKDLYTRLGKKNVVVVIDDLEDISDTMKSRLLSTQPSIASLAQDLILVKSGSPEEKMRTTKDAMKNLLR
ncbi:hypothetical protein GDO81_027801 [Engystomops pustulosus]|uniref:Uncharacterized protein n=1 Tax=Engystomops pustulosus TaxID=76066 RepID=A0AAV6ZPE7_ENGPU|nr:hypothetical protein GDO81_027801 [Engystomops pustulosus]